MGDWCRSANDLQTSKIEVADAEKGSEEPNQRRNDTLQKTQFFDV
jgi:hypothetical protein